MAPARGQQAGALLRRGLSWRAVLSCQHGTGASAAAPPPSTFTLYIYLHASSCLLHPFPIPSLPPHRIILATDAMARPCALGLLLLLLLALPLFVCVDRHCVPPAAPVLWCFADLCQVDDRVMLLALVRCRCIFPSATLPLPVFAAGPAAHQCCNEFQVHHCMHTVQQQERTCGRACMPQRANMTNT